jgi:hypothetical protein
LLLPKIDDIDADLVQMLMAVAMAGMLSPRLTILPPWGWETISGLLAVSFGWRCLSGVRTRGFCSLLTGHDTVHFFHCAATVYMVGILNSIPMCSATAGVSKYPVPTLFFVPVFVCHCIRELFQYHGAREDLTLDGTVAVACRIAMGATMALMLLTMD